jgi:hypothetical protein
MAIKTRMGMKKMSLRRSDDPWASISVDASQVLGRRVDGGHALSIYWVRSSEGAPGLLFRNIDPSAAPARPPKTRGISVHVGLSAGQDAEVRLFLLTPGDREVFHTFCVDVIAFSAGEATARAATAALFRRLDHWQTLLSKGTPDEMGPPEIRGLIGELQVLLRLAATCGIASALSSWVAPEQHPQDFALDNRLLEIKTRLAGSRQQAQISSLEQLDAGELPIYLVTVELAPSDSEASFSLNDIAHRVMLLAIDEGPDTRDRAERLLLERGYIEKEAYGVDCYVVSAERAFIVGDGFPRLVRSTTDRRVQQANYALDLTALGAFERDLVEIFPSRIQG